VVVGMEVLVVGWGVGIHVVGGGVEGVGTVMLVVVGSGRGSGSFDLG